MEARGARREARRQRHGAACGGRCRWRGGGGGGLKDNVSSDTSTLGSPRCCARRGEARGRAPWRCVWVERRAAVSRSSLRSNKSGERAASASGEQRAATGAAPTYIQGPSVPSTQPDSILTLSGATVDAVACRSALARFAAKRIRFGQKWDRRREGKSPYCMQHVDLNLYLFDSSLRPLGSPPGCVSALPCGGLQ